MHQNNFSWHGRNIHMINLINYLKMISWIDILGNYIIYSCEENNNAWSTFFLYRLFFFLSKMSLEHVTSIRMNNIRNYTTWLLGASFYLHIETYYRMKIRWNIISCLTNLTFIIIKRIVILATYLDIGWQLSIVSKKVSSSLASFMTFRVCWNKVSISKVQDVF